MRRHALAPAILAIIVILCAPFSSLPICGDPPSGRLVCYCCVGKNCTMLSCSKCKADTFTDSIDSSPEIILASFDQQIILPATYGKWDTFRPPVPVFIQVFVKPPNSV